MSLRREELPPEHFPINPDIPAQHHRSVRSGVELYRLGNSDYPLWGVAHTGLFLQETGPWAVADYRETLEEPLYTIEYILDCTPPAETSHSHWRPV